MRVKRPAGAILAAALAVSSVAGPPAASAATRHAAEFFARNPQGTVSCAIYSGYAGVTQTLCESYSRSREAKTTLSASGRVSVCIGHNPTKDTCNLGNAGENAPTLGYGRRVAVGRFRCSVLRRGVKCTVAASGKGFLFNPKGTVAVGGAHIRHVG